MASETDVFALYPYSTVLFFVERTILPFGEYVIKLDK